jgi:Protein of unknown function (DUF2567)
MRQPGRDEPIEAPGQPPGGQPPVRAAPLPGAGRPWPPGSTGLVDAGDYPQPLPPAGWRPVATERPARSWPPSRREIAVGLGALATLAALGLAVALAWEAVAPRLAFRIVSPGNAVTVTPEGEQFFATDGWFAVLTLAVGVLAAVLLWRVRSARGPVVLVGLALGGLAGAVVAWKFGTVLAPAPSDAALHQVGRVVYPALRLRALAMLVVEPVVAVVTYLLFTAFTSRDDLGLG